MIAKIRATTLKKAKELALDRNPDYYITGADKKATWSIRMRRR